MNAVMPHHLDDGPRDAPVMVMSGALGSTVEMWRPQVPRLTPRFRVIRIDHRGHGRSPVPPGPYRISDLADDALALLDTLGLDRVAWCGLSIGGMVGMYLGSEAPERLTSLTLCCTSSNYPDPSTWTERIAAVSTGGTAGIAEAVVSRWFTPDWAARHPAVVAEAVAMVRETSDEGYIACCEALRMWDHRDRLGAIAVPTLVIAGSADLGTPIDPHSQTLVENIPGARLEVVDAAHLATVEQPDATTALIAAHAAAG